MMKLPRPQGIRSALLLMGTGVAFALPLRSVVIAPTALYVNDVSPTATLTVRS